MSVEPTPLWLTVNLVDERINRSLGFEFELKRSARRRSLEVQVAGGEVTVRVPSFASGCDVFNFLHQKRQWVLTKLAQQRQSLTEFGGHELVSGSRWWFLGRPLTLQLLSGPRNQVTLDESHDDTQLCVQLSPRSRSRLQPSALKLLASWYRDQAGALMVAKTQRMAHLVGRDCAHVSFRKMRARWGHCSADNKIVYNWLVMQAPVTVVEYLIAHEVSHLRHFNHGREFWHLVERLHPTYNEDRAWLKTHGQALWF